MFSVVAGHWMLSYKAANDTLGGRFCSVVINAVRPSSMENLVASLDTLDVIHEILVIHVRMSTFSPASRVSSKALDIFSGSSELERYGPTQRFFFVERCLSDNILFLDDDVIPTKHLLMKLMSSLRRESLQVYGPLGRHCSATHGYRWPRDYPLNIILTPVLATSKAVVRDFKQHFPQYAPVLAKRHGNGEDIVFSLSFSDHFNATPKRVRGPWSRRSSKRGFNMHSQVGHWKRRTNICKTFGQLA